MRILVTGVTGFVGGHLAEALLATGGAEVFGLDRRGAWPADLSHLAGPVPLFAADLTDLPTVEAVLRQVRPDQLYHLAGYASNGQSFHEPDAAWAGNLTATRTLYDAVARWGGAVRILYVSSGMVYGAVADPARPCDESVPLRPVSPYAASKAAADLLSFQVTHHPGLDVVRVRPFNQIGPRQSPDYAVGHFARQIARIERGLGPPRLETGDLSARRDLTDVRDMVAAYLLLMEQGRRGEVYNAGRGEAVRMADVLNQLLSLASTAVEAVSRAERMRPNDVGAIVADGSRLLAATGWRPRITLDQSLRDTLDYWRRVESREGERRPSP
jgi:GDP-4-dehydro-6-deoxy-D-mannose reductase